MSSAETTAAAAQAIRIATLIWNLARSLVTSSQTKEPIREPISRVPPPTMVITP
jgi:hypothetical protein